jgi:hypothetical protein
MEVNTKLIVISRDYLRNGQTYVLSTSAYKLTFPTVARDTHGSHLRDLVSNHIKLDVQWINPQLLEVEQVGETLNVYYYGMVPRDTVLEDSFWLSTDLITNEELDKQKLVMKATSKL